MKSYLLLAGAGLAAVAGAQQPQRTVQQDFEAAQALDEAGNVAGALAAWQALSKRPDVIANKRSHAIVLVREAAALRLAHRDDEAIAAARAGLADLPVTDPSLREDRLKAWMNIGEIAEQSLDFAGAAHAYTEAEQAALAPADKVGAELGLLRTQTFVDPAAASAAAARADALIAGIKVDKTVLGELGMREAVLALNRGDIPAAQKLSRRAIDDLGGLSDRVDLRDVQARSTAAIAALLAKQPDEARRYIAATGAGRMGDVDVARGADMPLPDCGGEAGLRPDDFAVVQFAIADDGSVMAVTPIYAQGGGAVALEFARAVRNWSWEPDKVATLPKFFRYNVRMEMRCSTGFEHPSLNNYLNDSTRKWLAGQGVTLPEIGDRADAAALPTQRAALASAETRDPTSLQTLAALVALIENKAVGREETHDLATRALAIAVKRNAPPLTRLDLTLEAARSSESEGRRSRAYRETLRTIVTDPVYANDPDARAVIRLYMADAERKKEEQVAILRQVADDAALAKTNPLKVGALIRIASIEQQQDKPDAARAAFAQSGLTANQCALVDAPPRRLSVGGSFPEEARRWGFEGWVKTQYDVAASGAVENERVVLAYPPFVFDDAAKRTIAGARFAKTYRPDGELGCGALSNGIRFQMSH